MEFSRHWTVRCVQDKSKDHIKHISFDHNTRKTRERLDTQLLSYSNPVVQVKAMDSGALQMLLRILATTHPLRVKKKVLWHARTHTHIHVTSLCAYKHESFNSDVLCVWLPFCQVLFALASLLRHFPHAQRHFLSHGGLHALSELFRADEGGVLRTRIVTMLYDMISEKV